MNIMRGNWETARPKAQRAVTRGDAVLVCICICTSMFFSIMAATSRIRYESDSSSFLASFLSSLVSSHVPCLMFWPFVPFPGLCSDALWTRKSWCVDDQDDHLTLIARSSSWMAGDTWANGTAFIPLLANGFQSGHPAGSTPLSLPLKTTIATSSDGCLGSWSGKDQSCTIPTVSACSGWSPPLDCSWEPRAGIWKGSSCEMEIIPNEYHGREMQFSRKATWLATVHIALRKKYKINWLTRLSPYHPFPSPPPFWRNIGTIDIDG